MSTATLERPEVRWSAEAREAVGGDEAWFQGFDEALGDVALDESLAVRQDADTWYFVNDMDVSFPVDPAENLGLDTWDF